MKAAMDEEIGRFIANGSWELIERPCCVNGIKNRWLVMTKYHVNDTELRHTGDIPQHPCCPQLAPNAARHEERLPAEQAGPRALHVLVGLPRRQDQQRVQAVEELVWPELITAIVVLGTRRRADRRRLKQEPSRRGAVLQGRQQRGGLLGAGLCRRPALRQQQHRNAEGVAGARL
ncbi:unnamed protein product [Closterium sp. NIES-54]